MAERRIAGMQVAAAIVLSLGVLWLRGSLGWLFLGLSLAWWLIYTIKDRELWSIDAFNRNGFWPTLRASSFLLLMAGALVGTSIYLGWFHYDPHTLIQRVVLYTLWAFVQQWSVQCYFLRKLHVVFPNRSWSWTATVLLMGLFHLPNPFLAAATMILGYPMIWLFARYRNLLAVGLVHASLGLALAYSLPTHITGSMKVGHWYYDRLDDNHEKVSDNYHMRVGTLLVNGAGLARRQW